jgi:Domain of unknown function (DUF4258)
MKPMARMSRHTAEELIIQCLLLPNAIRESRHFLEELANENLTILDARYVIRHGHILNEPEFHVGKQEWNYRIEGDEPDGKWLAIVFSFKAENDAYLITVFSIRSRDRK